MSQDMKRASREKKVRFAVGMAAIDGGKPTPYTESLLRRYESGEISSADLRKAILSKYVCNA